MTAGHGVMREGAAIRGRAGSTSVVTSGVLTRIGVLVRRDVASEAQGAMIAAPVLEAVSVMTARAATAPTEGLVLRELLSVVRSGIAMIVGRVVRVARAGLRSGRGTIVGVPPVVSVVRSETVMIVLRVLLVSVARIVVMSGGLVARVVTAPIVLVQRVAIVGRVVRVARAGLRSGRGMIVGAPPVVSVVRSGIAMIVVPGVKVLIGGRAVRAVTAPIVLVPRVPPVASAARSGIATIVGRAAISAPTEVPVPKAPPVASVGRSGTGTIVGRVVRVARAGLRSGRGTIVGAPPVSAVRSGMTVVPGEKADIRAMTVHGRSHGIRVMSVPTVARVRGMAGTTVRRTPRRASRCPSSSRTSRLMSSTRKCVRSSAPCPTIWRSWSAGT
jgi:hypothetical protein